VFIVESGFLKSFFAHTVLTQQSLSVGVVYYYRERVRSDSELFERMIINHTQLEVLLAAELAQNFLNTTFANLIFKKFIS